MGIRDAIGDRWARFRAYLHSIPPHVWLGLLIGAVALVLAYLAWKNRNNALSPLSQLTPLSDTTTTTTTPATPTGVNLPPVPDIGNLVYPGLYYNYNTNTTVKPVKVVQHPITPKTILDVLIFRSPTAYTAPNLPNTPTGRGTNIMLGITPEDNPAAAILQSANTQVGYDIHAASHALIAKASPVAQSASAPAHGYDIHAASQAITNATHAVVSGAKVPLPPTQRGTNISF